MLPNRFLAEVGNADSWDEGEWENFSVYCQVCFRHAWSVVPPAVRTAGAQRLLHELEGGLYAEEWLETFFTADLLAALEGGEREDLFSFVIQVLANTISRSVLARLFGVGPFLSPYDAEALVKVLAEPIIQEDERDADMAVKVLESELPQLPSDSSESARRAMDEALTGPAFRTKDGAVRLSKLRYRIWPLEDGDIPR